MKKYINKQILEAINRGINLALDLFDYNDDIQALTHSNIKDINSASNYMNILVERILQIPTNNVYSIDFDIRRIIRKEYKSLLLFYKNNNEKFIAYSKEDLRALINKIVIVDKKADLNWIDTSKLTDMEGLFDEFFSKEFCGDISEWNVSKVENMGGMFFGCHKFNCDISNWDVSNVKNMDMMFCTCTHFNLPIGKWDVSKVLNMHSMLAGCRDFNLDLSNWNVSSVKNMSYMFSRCVKFNLDISMWDVNKVSNNSGFYFKAAFAKYPEKVPNFDLNKTMGQIDL